MYLLLKLIIFQLVMLVSGGKKFFPPKRNKWQRNEVKEPQNPHLVGNYIIPEETLWLPQYHRVAKKSCFLRVICDLNPERFRS